MKVFGKLLAICIAPAAGAPMSSVTEARVITGTGIEGDRYAEGVGSFNKKRGGVGVRQVSIMNARFFLNTPFDFIDSRRNLIIEGVELLHLLDGYKEFEIGEVRFRATKYLDPCERPSKLGGKPGFKETFIDTGAILADVVQGGTLKVGDEFRHEPKGY